MFWNSTFHIWVTEITLSPLMAASVEQNAVELKDLLGVLCLRITAITEYSWTNKPSVTIYNMTRTPSSTQSSRLFLFSKSFSSFLNWNRFHSKFIVLKCKHVWHLGHFSVYFSLFFSYFSPRVFLMQFYLNPWTGSREVVRFLRIQLSLHVPSVDNELSLCSTLFHETSYFSFFICAAFSVSLDLTRFHISRCSSLSAACDT